ncbi:ribonuclease HI [Candidatus Finniella inopinata]|uniref:Ribonuclease H n=2 Tax=Candidatus Finniella inopinata TaxID=1696036 RepID=A0A4Q7DIP0_9PROT|nr:ribonuclease HI [Candidatus Finniella inopinata]
MPTLSNQTDTFDFQTFLNAITPSSLVEIFTDGACSGNPGPGGWGAVLRCEGQEWEHSGGEVQTTNNRMEMLAAVESLTCLPLQTKIVLYTDSQYLKNGMNLWLKNWKKNGWKTADKSPVKNQDLWQRLDTLTQNQSVEWQWVRGHDGHAENERADALARNAIIAQRMGISS